MTRPQEARSSCSQCNGWYNSEIELYEHMQAVHRRCVPSLNAFRHELNRPRDFDTQLRISKKAPSERTEVRED
jgi:hypothetical protein